MLERLVENWLTRTTERALEIPFCQMLTAEGHRVVHLSRHGPFEQGKDIISVDPNGLVCAYQLKSIGPKLNQHQWEELVPQITRLVEIPVTHPSVIPGSPHEPFFVVNGELDEEVRREIADRNSAWTARNYRPLRTIVRGELLTRLTTLQTAFWPSPLTFERDLLQLFLSDGRACLDKPRHLSFLSRLVPLGEDAPEPRELPRSLASAAIFNTYALAPHTEADNHVAVVEGWTVFIALLTAVASKHPAEAQAIDDVMALALYAADGALDDLVQELKARDHFIEGNALVDAPFYRGRLTWLLSLVSVRELIKLSRNPGGEVDGWAVEFVDKHLPNTLLWGEAAFPQYLAMALFLNQVKPPNTYDGLIFHVLDAILSANSPSHPLGLPDPYHDLTDVVRMHTGITKSSDLENFKGRSYILLPAIYLLASKGWRQKIARLWPEISRIAFAEFRVTEAWQTCLWRSEQGDLRLIVPKTPQSWAELRDSARTIDMSLIPAFLAAHPEILLLFTIVYPHRLTADVAGFLDRHFKEVKISSRSTLL